MSEPEPIYNAEPLEEQPAMLRMCAEEIELSARCYEQSARIERNPARRVELEYVAAQYRRGAEALLAIGAESRQ